MSDWRANRDRFISSILDALEVLTGEELLTVVTRGDDGSLTAWTLIEDSELAGDVLNGWVDATPWNAPKRL